MTPNVLCLGPWMPDSPWRFFADALQYAGCRVVRVGPQVFANYSHGELPPVHTMGIFEPRLGGREGYLPEPLRFSYRPIVSGLGERGFETQVMLVHPEILPSMVDKPPSGLRFVEWEPVYGCDPYVHVWTNKGERTGIYDVTKEYPGSIRAHVERMNAARVVLAPKERLWEARACGAAARLDVAGAAAALDDYNSLDPEEIERAYAETLNKHTYFHHACAFLEKLGYERAMPRLWT